MHTTIYDNIITYYTRIIYDLILYTLEKCTRERTRYVLTRATLDLQVACDRAIKLCIITSLNHTKCVLDQQDQLHQWLTAISPHVF